MHFKCYPISKYRIKMTTNDCIFQNMQLNRPHIDTHFKI